MTKFDCTPWIESLRQGGSWLEALLAATPDHAWRQRPASDKWSLIEILAHLVDEEREDFRVRLLSTLDDPSRAWTPFDSEGWVTDRDYASKDPQQLLKEFREERRLSLSKLESLGNLDLVDWSTGYAHPSLGSLRAGDLLVSWCAHDHLHGQQILRTRWQLLEPSTMPFNTRYAMP
jgi:DinB superfamily